MTPAQQRLVDQLRAEGGEAEYWPLMNDWVKDKGSASSLAFRNICRTVDALVRDRIIEVTDEGYVRLLIPAFVLCVSLLLPSLAFGQSQVNLKPAQAAIILGNLGDAISTELALQRGGVREGSVVMSQRMTQRLALKAAGTAAQVWIVGRIGKEHPKLAKVVGFSAGAFFGGVTIHNVRVSR